MPEVLVSNLDTATPTSADYTLGVTAAGVVKRFANSDFALSANLVANIKNAPFNALGDGVSNDDAAFDAAEASDYDAFYLPDGRYLTTKTAYQLTGKKYTGPGQIIMGGYAQAPHRAFITTEQSVPSTNRLQMFDGGFSKAVRASYMFIGSGATGTPGAVYKNFTELSQDVVVHDYTGGFNTDPADHALGRSGAFVSKKFAYHGGQGDLTFDSYYGEVYTARAGATHFLANPALAVQNGDLGVSAAAGEGCYLQHSEFNFSDGGYAISVIDRVRNYTRTNAGATLNQVWIHDRPQSNGSQPIDAFYSPTGTALRGLDFTPATFDTDKAALVLKASDRIYLNGTSTPDAVSAKWFATSLGSEYITFDGTDLVLATSGVLKFGAAVASVATASTHKVAIKLTDGSTFYLLGTT